MAVRVVSYGLHENTLAKLINAFSKRSVTSFFEWEHKETETHTGQKFNPNDYRLSRFQDKSKQVNPNWAIKLIAEVPPIAVNGRIAVCDGGMGATGHPRVYINVDRPGCHSCLYCGLRFYKEDCTH